ncbi:MarR family EPS-associated transcriptional regulator [Pelagibacteraceae bacterium]|nr:MarR family EPS-associated transcriptional regulator [Pelagibacteraceae bacterium]MDC1158787.1 MarR family EPS-associated transcriptional regulator [Pelagibacteraceae bacterium]
MSDKFKKNDEEFLNILIKIKNNPNVLQRSLARDLGFSLGKLNYCLNELRKKGLVKINNFKKNKNKLGYVYLLTPAGIKEKTNMTIKFMKIKIQEYDKLKEEIEK